MSLALVNTHDATLVSAPVLLGPRSLGWSDAPPERLADEQVTWISLAITAGVELDRIAARISHSRTSTLVEHFRRPLEAMQVTSSRDLGL